MLSNKEIVENIILKKDIKKYSDDEISVNNIMDDVRSDALILTDRQLENLWREFGDTCIDKDECIDTDFFIWDKGTYREDIWHWFDERYSKGVYYLLYELDNID